MKTLKTKFGMKRRCSGPKVQAATLSGRCHFLLWMCITQTFFGYFLDNVV